MSYREISGVDLRELKFSSKELSYFLTQIQLLRQLHLRRATISEDLEKFIHLNFEKLTGFIPFLKTTVYFEKPFERVVINKKVRDDKRNARLHLTTQVKYPPPEVAKNLPYNRANIPKISAFYAGFGMLATALETEPTTGDLYTTTKWQQKKGKRISYIPIFHKESIVLSTTEYINDWNDYNKFLSQLDKNVGLVVKDLYEFITEAFTTPVNPNNKIEYIFSALFSNHFMYKPDFGVDAVYYPSVPAGLISSNIAIKPAILESHFDLIEVTESICIGSRSTGQNGWLSHRSANVINPSLQSEELDWVDEEFFDERVQGVIEAYNVELK